MPTNRLEACVPIDAHHQSIMNFKNQLQELCQKRGYPIPTYNVNTSGQSHRPIVVARVSVNWGGEELVEEATGEGLKRKDVEKKAAEQMYQRICESKLNIPMPAIPSASNITSQCSTSSSVQARSPSISKKNELQELLQKSMYNFPPPIYEEVPSQRKGQFTSKVIIRNTRNEVIEQGFGYGRTKKEADTDAAVNMLPKMQAKINSGNIFIPTAGKIYSPSSPPGENIDHELGTNIDDRLLVYSPHYETQIGTDNMVLCLARASCDVTAHGMGQDDQEALMDAKLNLICNLQTLGFM